MHGVAVWMKKAECRSPNKIQSDNKGGFALANLVGGIDDLGKLRNGASTYLGLRNVAILTFSISPNALLEMTIMTTVFIKYSASVRCNYIEILKNG